MANQLQRWAARLTTVPTSLNGLEDQRRKAAALGDEYPSYASWQLAGNRRYLDTFNQTINPGHFAARGSSINYNDDEAISDFEQFLLRPNVIPIVIGHVGQTVIQLIPEPLQLQPHEQPEDGPNDIRDLPPFVPTCVLGVWSDSESFRRGQYSDEGYGSDDLRAEPVRASGSLEVFQQLGLLYSKTLGSQDEFRATNYVLITDVYDDSIWVIWRKYIMDQNTAEEDLAKDVWQGHYAVFPGMATGEGERETIIYAKVAQNWNSLQPLPDTTLRFSQIRHASSVRNPFPEPTLVLANRTDQGGIRRENDFRSMPPRPERH